MIRPSLPSDEAGLKALWQVAFGDSPEAIEAFFSALYTPGMAIVWEEDSRIASAMYLLDAGLTPLTDGTKLHTSYAYALGTLPAYRGQGLGSAVTRAVIARSVELGFDCNVVCPAEESLFPYYRGLGYDHTLSITEDQISRSEAPKFVSTNKVMSTGFSIYFQLRLALSPECATIYTEGYLRYVEQVCTASGGGFVQLEVDKQTCLAALDRVGDRLFIREFLPASHAESGVRLLLDHFACQSATLRTGIRTGTNALKQRPFVLLSYAGNQKLPSDAGYFPFVLD